jgi:hypothetical protein
VEQHAARCSSCAYEVQDLRRFVTETAEVSRSFRVDQPVKSRARILEWRQRPIWSALAAAVLIGAGLYWYTSLHTAQRETALASLNDGNYQLSLDKSGHLRGAEGLEPDQRDALQTALSSGRLAVNNSSKFPANQQETLLGGPVAAPLFKALSPVGKVVIEDRPTFTWEPLATATGYRVRVYGTGYHKIAESPLVHGNGWQAITPLPRGESYTWTVTAESLKGEVRAPAPPQPEAAFQVVDAVTARALEQASSSRGTDHLLLAVLYARAGATDEARVQLGLLAAQNPGSKLVDQLKASIDQSVPLRNQSAPSPISTNPAQ